MTEQDAKMSNEPRKERDWRNMSIVEIAAENPSVSDYINHWEGRTLKAEATIREKESTVARLREALEDAIQSVRGPVHYSPFPVYMPQIGVEFVKRWEEALSPSPSAKSGGRDLKTEMEMWDSNAKVEDWRLQRYGECAACGGNLTAGHQCPRRKSVSPSANSGEKP